MGYEHVTVRLNSLLYKASSLATDVNLTYEEGTNSYFAVQNARARYEGAKVEIEEFINDLYSPFRREVEALNLSPFTD